MVVTSPVTSPQLKMLRAFSILFLSTASLLAHPHDELPVEHSQEVRSSLIKAKSYTLSEGLPHPSTEFALFTAEAQRRDTQQIVGFFFYKPNLKPAAAQAGRIRELITNPANLVQWEQKRCVGFHPDWALNWRSGWSKRHALICFGCSEVIFITPEEQLRYHLTPATLKKLKAELGASNKKRPAK